MNLDQIFAEVHKNVRQMEENENKPMPLITVGDFVLVESLKSKNLALVVGYDAEGEPALHFFHRPGNVCIPLARVKDDVVLVHQYNRATNEVDQWVKGGHQGFNRLCMEAFIDLLKEAKHRHP
ncbi:hypothetical protein [Anaerovibrio sp.]|uniref:hypothetical protein n=1 Tax=Anaerovibrio sp. TaxID=1872532 RepID=UPI0025C5E780|nr:hypothetical protein [Anaerovibrio sp.]MBR2143160.1 hypothetical protein [Anaerovibrio sp.]